MEQATTRRSITLRYFDGCPHWRTAYERVNQVVGEIGGSETIVELEPVQSPEHAERLRFIGSPTVLIDGKDPFAPESPGGFGLSCRVYQTPDGPAGFPTEGQLRDVLDDQATT